MSASTQHDPPFRLSRNAGPSCLSLPLFARLTVASRGVPSSPLSSSAPARGLALLRRGRIALTLRDSGASRGLLDRLGKGG